jgi:hypothetical protein
MSRKKFANARSINKCKGHSMNIKAITAFLDTKWPKIPARQRQWHVDHNLYDFVLCEKCNQNTVNWSTKNKTYSRFCSSKCAHTHESVKEKTKQTCLTKYGAVSNLSTEQNKTKQQNTCLTKYGVTNFSKTQQFKSKYRNTCLSKYGVDNVSKLESTKQKIDVTHQAKYNRKRYSQVHICSKIINRKNDRDYMLHLYQDLKMPLTEIAAQLNLNHSQLCVHFKNNLGIDITRHRVSWPEMQIYNYVKQFVPDAVQSDRSIIKPKELDIVVACKKIAIEYNGLSWHGEINGNKNRYYHVDKMKQANQQGYRLIQIFSNEWTDRQDLTKSRLKNILGFSQKIPARKCQIAAIDKKTSDAFLNNNHIQGMCFHKTAYGLIYQNNLIALMTFGRSRFNKNIDQELLRYACVQNHTVQGGASRLFKHFLNVHRPKSIISYCDLRWNTGNLYQQLGFAMQKITDPNYWYVVNQQLENRVKYQKHKLAGLLTNFDPSLTEWENMSNHGYDRVWDCGNSVWVYS